MIHLEPLPEVRRTRILAGAPCRKNPDILRPCLESVLGQILPPQVDLTVAVCDDNVLPDSTAYLQSVAAQQPNVLYFDCRSGESGDFADNWGSTHQWTPTAMQRVGQIKNHLIREAMIGGYDALWLFDADLILSPRTLWSLYWSDAPIACGVFWTRWVNADGVAYLPQVWLNHPYELQGRGMAQHEFLRRLHLKERLQVWGQGACSLYRRDVLERGVSFEPVADLPTSGLWQGEDRHLSTRATRLHVPMFADPWPRIYHVYHTHDVARIPDYATKYAQEQPGSPVHGDWVSLHLRAVEPVPVPGGMGLVGVQHVRGRLGRLPLIDALEDTVTVLQRGESRIVGVVFPEWAEAPLYRGQKRLIEVRLIDFYPDEKEPWDG